MQKQEKEQEQEQENDQKHQHKPTHEHEHTHKKEKEKKKGKQKGTKNKTSCARSHLFHNLVLSLAPGSALPRVTGRNFLPRLKQAAQKVIKRARGAT